MPYRSREDLLKTPVRARIKPELAGRYSWLEVDVWYPLRADALGALTLVCDDSEWPVANEDVELELPYRNPTGPRVREFNHSGRTYYAELMPGRFAPAHVALRYQRWVIFDPIRGEHWTLPVGASPQDSTAKIFAAFEDHLQVIDRGIRLTL
jgi:hypothetical protein